MHKMAADARNREEYPGTCLATTELCFEFLNSRDREKNRGLLSNIARILCISIF